MAIDALPVWKTTLAALPKVNNNSWAANFANWYRDRIVAITTNPANLVPVGFVFTFSVSTFITQLQALTPTSAALTGVTNFANAWEAALLASTAAVQPGSFVPPSSNPTLFSSVGATTIVPASIVAGKAKILELISAPVVDDALSSQFPEKFRDATLLLKIKVVGLNSVNTPAPLTADNVPLI